MMHPTLSERVVCLVNSRKIAGRCVGGQAHKRPVVVPSNQRPAGARNLRVRPALPDGKTAQLLDIIEIRNYSGISCKTVDYARHFSACMRNRLQLWPMQPIQRAGAAACGERSVARSGCATAATGASLGAATGQGQPQLQQTAVLGIPVQESSAALAAPLRSSGKKPGGQEGHPGATMELVEEPQNLRWSKGFAPSTSERRTSCSSPQSRAA
jgi:hypothetical protein